MSREVRQGTLDTKPKTRYPEHEKMLALGDRKDDVQNFIDWLLDEQQMTLAMWGEPRSMGSTRENLINESHLYQLERAGHPITKTFKGRGLREKIMAAYFDINLDEISKEKDQMLDDIRAAQ